MTQFVRFRVDDARRFAALQQVFSAIKAVKNLDFADETDEARDEHEEAFDYDVDRLHAMMPEEVRTNFIWPSADQMQDHLLDPTRPVAIYPPGTHLGECWSFVRIVDLIDSCEYTLDRCEMVGADRAEMHVETWSYPYGGLNPLMALVEGFGFPILGVDECGRFETREELDRNRGG